MTDEVTGKSGGTLLGKLITWVIIAAVVLLALRLVFVVLGVGLFLIFRVVPLLLIGWLLLKAWQHFNPKSEI